MTVKFRHIALLMMMALAISCSKDDGDMNGGNGKVSPGLFTPIAFSANSEEENAVTRATLAEKGVTTFFVYGYKNMSYDSGSGSYGDLQQVFPGYTVNWTPNSAATTTTNSDGWEYVNQQTSGEEQIIKYWDWDAKAYRFFATTGTIGASGVTLTTGATEASMTFDADASSDSNIDAAPYFSQLWFSDGNPANYPDRQFGQPVQLRFLKPFTRVRFLFTFVEGLSFGREKLSHISFHPTVPQGSPAPTIATAGTVTVTYPLTGTETVETWTTSNTTGINAFTIDYYEPILPVPDPDPDGIAAFNANAHHWYTVLPNTTQGSYTLEVAVVTDEVKTVIVPAEYMSWKPGYEYTYKFKITEGGSVTMDIIQVAINDWSNKQSSGHSVYNW